ncbi:MAG: kelch repeat-containing protein [Myxococcota bacterium]
MDVRTIVAAAALLAPAGCSDDPDTNSSNGADGSSSTGAVTTVAGDASSSDGAMTPSGTGTTGSVDTTAAPGETTDATGDTTGNPVDDTTGSGGDPCDGACAGDTPLCDEDANGGAGACVQCLVDTDCDDDYECSVDTCDAAGTCLSAYSDTKDCQPTWALLAPGDAPAARFWPSMAYDAANEEVVLFGGLVDATMNGETWTWDGTSWTEEAPATSPTPRWVSGAAYDRARERVVLFGGITTQFGTTGLDETWEWDGQEWEQIITPQAPSARGVHGNLTYDTDREVVVLFGGGTQPSQPVLNDVWEYDGTTWTEVDMGTGPEARVATCFEYAGPTLGSVLFGGGDWNPYYGDTWHWDGMDWTELSPASAPSDRQSLMCAYDTFRERLVLFGGGLNPTPLENDIWEFDGVDWTEGPGGGPADSCCRGFAYDEARREIVTLNDGDTWTFGP